MEPIYKATVNGVLTNIFILKLKSLETSERTRIKLTHARSFPKVLKVKPNQNFEITSWLAPLTSEP